MSFMTVYYSVRIPKEWGCGNLFFNVTKPILKIGNFPEKRPEQAVVRHVRARFSSEC
jgi:hypothetical protein